jgi:hypothetical protein
MPQLASIDLGNPQNFKGEIELITICNKTSKVTISYISGAYSIYAIDLRYPQNFKGEIQVITIGNKTPPTLRNASHVVKSAFVPLISGVNATIH